MSRPHVPGRRRVLVAAAAGATALAVAAPMPARAGLPEVIAAARPSVVPVGTFNALENPRFAFRGSGFAVGDGSRIVTNFHVLAESTGAASAQMAVLLPRAGGGNEARMARVVATERMRDLALLQIDGPPLPPLALGEAGLVPEGSDVVLIGFPIGGLLGFTPVTHRGIVASVTAVALPAVDARQLNDRLVSRLREGPFELYQLDANAFPGNSGGPLLDAASGRVVGVVNMVLVRNTRESALSSPTGVTYAIPVRFVRELLARADATPPPGARPGP